MSRPTETWEEIEYFTPEFECDICHSTKQTKMGQIPINDGNPFIQAGIRWIICKKCHAQGWRPPSYSTNNYYIYKNINTSETRNFVFGLKLPYSPTYPTI